MLVFKLENFDFIENLLRGEKEIEDSNNITICQKGWSGSFGKQVLR